MLQKHNRGPHAWGRGGGPGRGARRELCLQDITARALQVYRPSLGRWATVAKLVEVEGELVLAVPYRHRPRLQDRISLPLVALRYALQHGATSIVVRLDQDGYALKLPLEKALRLGERQVLDGQAEVWLPLCWFSEVGWVDWPWTAQAIRLGPGPEELPRQLALIEGVQP